MAVMFDPFFQLLEAASKQFDPFESHWYFGHKVKGTIIISMWEEGK